MIHWKHLFTAFAIAALTSQVSDGDVARLGGNGMRVEVTPIPQSGSQSLTAAAECRVRVNNRQAMLHWTTSTFRHIEYPEIESDATIEATVIGTLGAVDASPRRVIKQTNQSANQDEAAIAMGIAGNGEVKVDLRVSMENAQPVEGNHCATVVLTITGY
ncbi:MAG: hypothetical protein WBD31_08770 [Rubripirellula sp.]